MRTVLVGGAEFGGPSLAIIAGPCVAESLDLCRIVAGHMRELTARMGLPYVFKASFDKANRTSGSSRRGPGLNKGLEILDTIKREFGVPVTTDVHEASQCATIAQVADLIQIPAFLCRQTDLLLAAAETGKPVNVKKGQFLAPWDCENIVAKLSDAAGVILTERGTTFGYNTLVVDMAGLPVMRSFGVPVVFDATHSAQRPGGAGNASGGNREAIPYLARAAVAAGTDGVFMEVHPDPDNAWSDAATQWPMNSAENLVQELAEIRNLVHKF